MPYLHHRHYPLSPVIPANTSQAAPVSTPWPLTDGILHSIKVRIPPGHNGLTGFRVTYQGQQIMPWSNFAWEIGSGTTEGYAWDEEIMASGVVLICYNTDFTAHQFFATADITPRLPDPPHHASHPVNLPAPGALELAAIAGLSG